MSRAVLFVAVALIFVLGYDLADSAPIHKADASTKKSTDGANPIEKDETEKEDAERDNDHEDEEIPMNFPKATFNDFEGDEDDDDDDDALPADFWRRLTPAEIEKEHRDTMALIQKTKEERERNDAKLAAAKAAKEAEMTSESNDKATVEESGKDSKAIDIPGKKGKEGPPKAKDPSSTEANINKDQQNSLSEVDETSNQNEPKNAEKDPKKTSEKETSADENENDDDDDRNRFDEVNLSDEEFSENSLPGPDDAEFDDLENM